MKRKSLTLLIAQIAIASLISSAQGGQIPIVNAQFGSDSVGSLDGWSTEESSDSSYVRSDSGTGPVLMVLFGSGGSDKLAYCSQVLSASLEKDTRYTLSFDIRTHQNWDIPFVYEGRLYAGSDTLSHAEAITPGLTHEFQRWSYSFLSDSVNPNIGEPLKIEFFAQAKAHPAGSQYLYIDNVELTAVSVPPTYAETTLAHVAGGTNSGSTGSAYGVSFTTPDDGRRYILTAFRFLGSGTPQGAGRAYLFSSDRSSNVSRSNISGYTTDRVAVSEGWNGNDYLFDTVILEPNQTYWIFTDSDGFSPGLLIPATADSKGYINGNYGNFGDTFIEQSYSVNFEVKGNKILRFRGWQETFFSAQELQNPEISSATADPGGFGISNLQRYAFNLDAIAPDARRMLTYYHSTPDGTRRLTINVAKNPDATDVLFVPEVSWSLKPNSWLFGEDFVERIEETESFFSARDRLPDSTAKFMRVRVEMLDLD